MKRIFARKGDRIVLWVLLALVVITLILSALRQYAGLALIHGELYLYLPMLILLVLLGWGMSAIVRRLKHTVVRGIAGGVMGLVLMVLFTIGMSYGGYAAGLSFPQKYVDMRSPDGKGKLTVMRELDTDEARIAARREARLAADSDGIPEAVAEDYGYRFTAYATDPLGIFYRLNTLKEGEVHIGFASAAELMVEWEEDGRVGHFYVKNPEVSDGGEMRAVAR